MTNVLSLLSGWVLDLAFGDPRWLPHPVVGFGRMIAFFEHHLNRRWRQEKEPRKENFTRGLDFFTRGLDFFARGLDFFAGSREKFLGGLTAVGLIAAVFAATLAAVVLLRRVSPVGALVFDAVLVFYCLAGTTLIREVRAVFLALDRSTDEGRKQVARIVGRDTSALTPQEVRTAALETLAENLSDGVVAPLFWLALLGTPGMMAYKMVNTLDSMIGYRTPRYRDFGCVAARIDDAANFLPARLTSLLMVAGYKMKTLFSVNAPHKDHNSSKDESLKGLFSFVRRYGRAHASPNSGYPEAALAGILDCRFGGPHLYFGQLVDKPFIGDNDRPLTTADMRTAIAVNRAAEVIMVALTAIACIATGHFV